MSTWKQARISNKKDTRLQRTCPTEFCLVYVRMVMWMLEGCDNSSDGSGGNSGSKEAGCVQRTTLIKLVLCHEFRKIRF